MIVKQHQTYRAFRIAPDDTNKMVILFDPEGDQATFISVIEIFDVGGRTPPNKHDVAQEMFFVLSGQGRAHGAGMAIDMQAGDSLMVPPGGWHEVENTGDSKLYCLTFMTPNEGFAELIRAGVADTLDDEDWAVIRGPAAASPAA